MVRRANEWDGPSMRKVYAPYIGTCRSREERLPELGEYVQRIDRYTYGLGWLLCEIDHQTVGFCHLSEDPGDPEDLFSVEFQVYVRQDLLGRGIGTALWTLMRDMMEMGSRRQVLCRVNRLNQPALAFFQKMGFVPLEGEPEGETVWLRYELNPADPQASRPVKPYLVESEDYESAREWAAALVNLDGLEKQRAQ